MIVTIEIPPCEVIMNPCCMCNRSDLGGADIYGADFTNALIDKTQQMVSSLGLSFPSCERKCGKFVQLRSPSVTDRCDARASLL